MRGFTQMDEKKYGKQIRIERRIKSMIFYVEGRKYAASLGHIKALLGGKIKFLHCSQAKDLRFKENRGQKAYT